MIDSHCHLDSPNNHDDAHTLIVAARAAGVSALVTIGCDARSAGVVIDIASRYPDVFAAIGFHPHDAKDYSPERERELRERAVHPKVVAIGEIGLDFYRDHSPRDTQREVFRAQLRLAAELGMPIVIHARESFAEAFAITCEFVTQLTGVVFHCFSEGVKEAEMVFARGWRISVGGAVTYKNSRMAEVAAMAPLDQLLLETDAPYISPEPFRGKVNQPAYLRYTLEKVAQIKGLPVAEVEIATDHAARTLFHLPDPGSR